MELLFEFLTRELGLAPSAVAKTLWHDYQRGGRSDKPPLLRDYLRDGEKPYPRRSAAGGLKRQTRHLANVAAR